VASASLTKWATEGRNALDEIEAAHRSVGGSGRGRRYATLQINHAYAVLLSSHFQSFCRALHSECVDHLVQMIPDARLRVVVRVSLIIARKLDRGNPTPGHIGSDFDRLGLRFWDEIKALDRRNVRRKEGLEELTMARNAIAHQDFSKAPVAANLQLRLVRSWRQSCDQLARSFDDVMRIYLTGIIGANPW
jgi:hypothetical protein